MARWEATLPIEQQTIKNTQFKQMYEETLEKDLLNWYVTNIDQIRLFLS